MNKSKKGLIITAVFLTTILVVFSVITINRWRNFSDEEAVRKKLEAEYDRIAETEAELLLELEELRK